MGTIPHAIIDPLHKEETMSEPQLLSERVIAAADGTGCNLSLKFYKGAISIIIMTKFVQNRATLQAETQKVRYCLTVENDEKDQIANWNVDCDFSSSFSLLQVFPCGDMVASMAGNLVFHLSGFLDDITSSDSPKSNVSTTGSEKERKYYADLLTQRLFCDATLAVEDSGSYYDMPCHRVILSANSPVFQNKFAGDPRMKRVEISGLNLKCVQNMLDYIYCGQRFNDNLELSDVKYLLEAADRFKLEELKELCEMKLMRFVRMHNVLEFFKLSDISQAEQLQDFIFDFICKDGMVLESVRKMLFSADCCLDEKQKYNLMTAILFRGINMS